MLVIRFMFKGYVSSSILILRALPRHIHESKSGTALTIIYDASRVHAMREKGQGRMLGETALPGCAEQEKSCKDSPGLLFTALYYCVLVMVKGVFCLSAGQMTIFGRY